MELEEVGGKLALKELELSAQGYPQHQVEAAIRYAWRRAHGVASKARTDLQQAVFLANLEENLEAAARWLDGNAQAAADRDMERGVDRAAREGKVERGYRRMGVDGRQASSRWRQGVPASKEGYKRFFGSQEEGDT